MKEAVKGQNHTPKMKARKPREDVDRRDTTGKRKNRRKGKELYGLVTEKVWQTRSSDRKEILPTYG